MTQIRVAIIGAGGIGGVHLKSYGAWQSLCEVVGVADVNLAAAQEKAAQMDCLAFDNYVRMLDEVRPDAISICTPPHLHLPIVCAAAARQIHVLCEKPPARTYAETAEMVEAMEKSGALLQFAFCHRFHQPIVQAQELIQSGQIGRVVQIYNRFGFRFARAGNSWFTEREIAGGGIIIDTLVHSIDIFRALAGEVVHVAAAASTTLPIAVEDSASLLLTSESGVIGSLTCSWVTPVSEAEVRIYGTEGEIVVDYNQSQGLRFRLADDAKWHEMPFDQPDRFTLQAGHFLECVGSHVKPLVGGEDGLAVMRVIDAAYKSIEEWK